MNGYKDNELALRWYQFGVFSPINRLHSSSNPFCGKEPWNYPEPYCSDMEKILRFRHALIPYMYTLNYRCHCEHIPVIIPMYYYYPFEEKAYSYKNQYFLGSEMLVCPVTTKIDEDSQKAVRNVLYQPEYGQIYLPVMYTMAVKMEKVRFYVEIFKVFLCLDVQVQ